MKQEAAPTSCFCILGIAAVVVLAFVVRDVVAFFNRPDALQQIVVSLEGLGMCLGAGIAFVILLFGWSQVSDKISRALARRVVYKGSRYSVRCYPVLMEKWAYGPLPEKLAEEPGQASKWPFDFTLAMSNHGPCILAPSIAPTLDKTNPNVAFPLGLFSPAWSETVFISLGTAKLYYLLFQRQGDFKFELGPADSFGYTHETPNIPAGHDVTVILLCQCLQARADLERFEMLEHPLQLKLTVLDGNGQYDLQATSALYADLYERIEASRPVEDDDSWMYRSRPIYW
jgi:hypothetical protein